MTVWEGGLLRQPPSTGPSYVSLLLQRFTQRTTHSLKPISSITTSRMSAQVLPGCTRSCLGSPALLPSAQNLPPSGYSC